MGLVSDVDMYWMTAWIVVIIEFLFKKMKYYGTQCVPAPFENQP
jgi:hypothetical protein